MKVLVIGAGFLGKQIAETLNLSFSTKVTKTKLDPSLCVKQILLKDSTYSKLNALVKDFDTIIVTAAPNSKEDYQITYSTLSHALHKALKGLKGKTVIYTSSTSVYKEKEGGLVFENSPLDLERSSILIEAEKTLLSLNSHRIVIARLSGLYGRNRPLESMLKSYHTRPILKKMINLCSDRFAKNFILYAVKYPISGIFNVSEKTVWNTDLYEELFFKKPLIDENALSFHGGSKKIMCQKLKGLPNFFD